MYGRVTNYILVKKSVDDKSALYKAYKDDALIKSRQQFRSGNIISSFPLEAKGFSSGETRYVISFAFPNRQKAGRPFIYDKGKEI